MTTKPLTTTKQPVKAIAHQDLFQLQETLEHLQSWEKPLDTLATFFTLTSSPLNKKQLIRDYHANSQIFQLFFRDFLKQSSALEKQLSELVRRKKIDP